MDDSDRTLNWDGCYNIRDLGGLPLIGGGHIRRGALIRADQLGHLTALGKDQMLAYGVRTIVDLRTRQEAAREPSADFDGQFGAPLYLSTPTVDDFAQIGEQTARVRSWAEMYVLFLDTFPANHARIIEAITAAPDGPVAFHCHSGKDRTGIVAALLLELAGVPRAAIAADYALSQRQLWPRYEQLVAEAGGEENVNPFYKPVTEPQSILDTLAHLDSTYGGVADYLRGGGLPATAIDRLRRRLIGTENGR